MTTEPRFQKLDEITRQLQGGDTPHRAAAAALASIREQWGELLSDIDDGNTSAGSIPPANLALMYDAMISVLTDQRLLIKQELEQAFAPTNMST